MWTGQHSCIEINVIIYVKFKTTNIKYISHADIGWVSL